MTKRHRRTRRLHGLQSFALYPHLSVAENFAYPLRERRSLGRHRARVREAASMRPHASAGHKPATLGRCQQRVALGRIQRPRILLLDEPPPTWPSCATTCGRSSRLHRQLGMTVVFATPDEPEALYGEEFAVMRDGAVSARHAGRAL
jgi:multiple sugar transport system ATP-binding protein